LNATRCPAQVIPAEQRILPGSRPADPDHQILHGQAQPSAEPYVKPKKIRWWAGGDYASPAQTIESSSEREVADVE
jgi:hypothetical protein